MQPKSTTHKHPINRLSDFYDDAVFRRCPSATRKSGGDRCQVHFIQEPGGV